MRRRRFLLTGFLLGLLGAGRALAAEASPHPIAPFSAQRIMSLNLCTDRLLGWLAPERLVSVTWLAQDDRYAPNAATLRGLPANHASIEEVIRLKPDLVVTLSYASPLLLQQVQQLGIPVLQVPLALSIDDIYLAITQLAQALNATERGAQIQAEMREKFARARQSSAVPRTLLSVQPSGWSEGSPSLMDDVIRRLGHSNGATALGIGGWGKLDIESVIKLAPDVLLLPANPDDPQVRGDQWLQHPALHALAASRQRIDLPSGWFNCGTPEIADAALWLDQQLADFPAPSDVTP